MTVIAYDGKTLAADRMTSAGGAISSTLKLHRVPGMLVGCAGTCTQIMELLHWMKGGCKPEDFPSALRKDEACAQALAINGTGEILYFDGGPFPMKITAPFHAIGSGQDFALAAMLLGKTAAGAVAVASELSTSCGGGVDTLSWEDA